MKARTSGRGGPCEAVQYSDQMQCARCGLAYDVNDPEPPECRLVITTPQKEQNGPSKAREILDRLGL